MKKLILILFISLFLHYPFSLYGQDVGDYVAVNPSDGVTYLYKRLREKLSLFVTFPQDKKAGFQKSLVWERLAELKYVVEKKEMFYFENSTKRYFTTAGQLTSFLTDNKIENEYQPVREMFDSHIPALEELRDNFDDTTAEWRFLQDDINYLKEYTNRLQKP